MLTLFRIFAVLALCFCVVHSFFPSQVQLGSSMKGMVGTRKIISAMNQHNPDKNVLGSKLMPPFSEAEMTALLQDLNITNFDLSKDPELAKWSPSKQFFEKFGFQNNTERYKRKTMHVKMDFYSNYTKPILPQYKTFLSDLLTVTFVQTVDSRYCYDILHAFGICTQYYTIMKGYALQEEIDVIFNEMMRAVGFDPVRVREDAKRALELIKDSKTLSDEEFLAGTESDNELGKILQNARENRFFKYTDAWGVGLARLMELRDLSPGKESFEKWGKVLRWVSPNRLLQSWDEFCADQIRMQGVEAMQKQLMIREKKRAAARLESKAAAFDDKRKALQELNEMIAERREQLIQEAKELKKKYEPDAYEKILLSENSATVEAILPNAGS